MSFAQKGATVAIKSVTHRQANTVEEFGPVSIQVRAHNGYQGVSKFPNPCETPKQCVDAVERACKAATTAGLKVGGVLSHGVDMPTDPKKLLAFVRKSVKAGMTLWVSRRGAIMIGDKGYYPGTKAPAQPKADAAPTVDLSDISDLLD